MTLEGIQAAMAEKLARFGVKAEVTFLPGEFSVAVEDSLQFERALAVLGRVRNCQLERQVGYESGGFVAYYRM